MFKYFLYKIGQLIVNVLPLQSSYAFAQFFSDMQYYLSPRDRQAVRNNLKIITGKKDGIEHEVRDVFRNFGRYLVEFFRMKKSLTKEYIQKNIEIKNFGVIGDVLKKGKGGIVVSAHMGNWEMGGILIPVLGNPILAVALPHKDRWVNNLFNAQRVFFGMTVVSPNIAIRRCLETLKDNRLVGLVADRDFTNHGVKMEFLKRRAIIPKGPAIFSIKTGAPVIPCFLLRKPDGSFLLELGNPINPPENGSAEQIDDATLINFIRKYLATIEEKIYAFPTQWLMFREFGVK